MKTRVWCLQLFDSVAIVASPGSPGSKPLNTFDPVRGAPVRMTSSVLRGAMETAEAQAETITQPKQNGGRSVKFTPESIKEAIHEEDHETLSDNYPTLSSDGHPALSESLRQASIASCASEWVDVHKIGETRKR